MKKIFAILLSAAAVTVSASAQTLQTEFFLDNNVYSYRFNPAVRGEKGFVGFAINNLSLSGASNIGAGSLLFKNPDGPGLVTGLNSAISTEQFLGGLKRSNNINVELDESLLSFGFWTKRNHFHTVEFNLRALAGVGIPGDLFAFLKTGSRSTTYDLSALAVNAQSFVELAYGFSAAAGKSFTVGGRAKFLAGLANVGVGCNRAGIAVNSQNIMYDTDLYLKAAASFAEIGTRPSENDPSVDVLDLSKIGISQDLSKMRPGGYGAALDLGMTYKPVKGLTLSLSVLDLGGICWKYNILGTATGADKFTGVTLTSLKNTSSVEQELNEALEKLKKAIEFKADRSGAAVSSFEMIPFTLNAGARYSMPFYDRLSVGALATYRSGGLYTFWDARAGMTITPINWFSLAADYGYNSYGLTYGAAMSITVACINLRLAFDSYSGKTGTYKGEHMLFAIPYPVGPFRYQLDFGFTITFGKRHNAFTSGPTGKNQVEL